MRLHIHAGLHKTATTTFQKSLLSHSDALAVRGYQLILTPREVGRRGLDSVGVSWLAERLDGCAADGVTDVVLSSEAVSLLPESVLARILAPCPVSEIRVTLGIRHWFSRLPSMWAQAAKRRDALDFRAYLDRLAECADQHADTGLLATMSRMRGVADVLQLVAYDPEPGQLAVIPALYRSVGLDPAAFLNPADPAPARNVRWDYHRRETIRLTNAIACERLGLPIDEKFRSNLGLGLPVMHFDLGRTVETGLAGEPAIQDSLNASLNQGRQTFMDFESLSWLTELEARTQEGLAEMDWIEVNGPVLRRPPVKAFDYSRLRSTDLPPDVHRALLQVGKAGLHPPS